VEEAVDLLAENWIGYEELDWDKEFAVEIAYYMSEPGTKADRLSRQVDGFAKLGLFSSEEEQLVRDAIANGRIIRFRQLLAWIQNYESYWESEKLTPLKESWTQLAQSGFITEANLKGLNELHRASFHQTDPRKIPAYLSHHTAAAVPDFQPDDPRKMEALYRQIATTHPDLAFESISVKAEKRTSLILEDHIDIEIDFGDQVLRDQIPMLRHSLELVSGEHYGVQADPQLMVRIFNMRLKSKGDYRRLYELKPSPPVAQVFLPDSIHYVLYSDEQFADFPIFPNLYLLADQGYPVSKTCIRDILAWTQKKELLELGNRSLDEVTQEIWLKSPSTYYEVLALAPGVTTVYSAQPEFQASVFRTLLDDLIGEIGGNLKTLQYKVEAELGGKTIDLYPEIDTYERSSLTTTLVAEDRGYYAYMTPAFHFLNLNAENRRMKERIQYLGMVNGQAHLIIAPEEDVQDLTWRFLGTCFN